ncbi:GNAT family N-acetyltransferase [Marinomonas sp. TI.3.20]|uniref:GNAT family N-acetyltransferase n=1 Tax=Marinomonas sp. TI.3.20 TaxID=3121296 RepID=UPI00311E46DE
MKISLQTDDMENLQTIARWYFEEWGHLNSSLTERRIFEGLSAKLEKDDDFLTLLTIHTDSELVAVADLKYREHKDYPDYEHWIGGVYVKPEHRGKGYAGALIDKAKEHVAKLNISELYLQCEAHNTGLYLKHGFKPLHAAVYSGVDATILIFSKNT